GPARGALESLDSAAHDSILRARPAASYFDTASAGADPRAFITIVAIDERTLSELGAYNGGYPRRYHAQVVENLLAAPPRVIAMDLGFFEPTDDDAVLAAALDDARSLPVPTSVILGTVGLKPTEQTSSTTSHSQGEVAFQQALLPVPLLADRADLALANMVPDDLGTVRSMPLLAGVQGTERP